MRRLAIVLSVCVLSGCGGGFLPALAKAAQGAQWLGTVLDVADAGADAYFARHPSLDAERDVDAAVRRARSALSALDAALATAADEDAARASVEARRAYAELHALLDALGVLVATPPAGGAETDAPAPAPLDLPLPDEMLPR